MIISIIINIYHILYKFSNYTNYTNYQQIHQFPKFPMYFSILLLGNRGIWELAFFLQLESWNFKKVTSSQIPFGIKIFNLIFRKELNKSKENKLKKQHGELVLVPGNLTNMPFRRVSKHGNYN